MAEGAGKPIVFVAGATGQQGGGTVDALLQQGRFAVRGLTRDKTTDKAKALAAKGVEVVEGDASDKQSLVKAMTGAQIVFFVTAVSTFDEEVRMGKNGIDAAKEAGIKHFVWSGLEDVRKVPGVTDKLKEISDGHYVPHFESKAAITEYLTSSGVPFTVLLTCFFYDNITTVLQFQPQEDGSFSLFSNVAADKPLAAHEVADIGRSAAVIIGDPENYIGKTVAVCSDFISPNGFVAALAEVTGKTLKYVELPTEKMAAMGYPGAEDYANMFAYYSHFDNYNELRKNGTKAFQGKRFKEWATDNKKRLQANLEAAK